MISRPGCDPRAYAANSDTTRTLRMRFGPTRYGYSSEFKEFMRTHPVLLGRAITVGRTVMELQPVHIRRTRRPGI